MSKFLPPILLVEDDDNDIFFAKRAVESAKIPNPLNVVTDGVQAVEYLTKALQAETAEDAVTRPGLVLLDLKLPRMKGLEVLAWIRAQKQLATIPVVIMSSSIEPNDVKEAYALGANSFLQKPPTGAKLIELMASLSAYWLQYDMFFGSEKSKRVPPV